MVETHLTIKDEYNFAVLIYRDPWQNGHFQKKKVKTVKPFQNG